jgi:hypothetical protein
VGSAMLSDFLARVSGREELADVSSIESREHDREVSAAVQMQAAARGHATRMVQGEQATAATRMQATARGRSARREMDASHGAATKVQAIHRGRSSRRTGPALVEGHHVDDTSPDAEAAAAIRMQAAARGHGARVAQGEQVAAATKVQATSRGRSARREVEASHEAATKVQAIQRGRTSRREP